MSALIIVGHRRCAAPCYNAIHRKCRCVCLGKNHGVGQKDAMTNTLNNVLKYVRKWGRKNTRIVAQEQLPLPMQLQEALV
jgi:hypothetical protein